MNLLVAPTLNPTSRGSGEEVYMASRKAKNDPQIVLLILAKRCPLNPSLCALIDHGTAIMPGAPWWLGSTWNTDGSFGRQTCWASLSHPARCGVEAGAQQLDERKGTCHPDLRCAILSLFFVNYNWVFAWLSAPWHCLKWPEIPRGGGGGLSGQIAERLGVCTPNRPKPSPTDLFHGNTSSKLQIQNWIFREFLEIKNVQILVSWKGRWVRQNDGKISPDA